MSVAWDNIFTGHDLYTDVFTAYPSMYTDASQQGSVFELYHQMIKMMPYDLALIFWIFAKSLFIIVIFLALFHTFFLPIIRRPQRW